MYLSNVLTFFVLIFLLGSCTQGVNSESENTTILFETEFEYKLEKTGALNFDYVDDVNGLDSSMASVKTLKQDPTLDYNYSPGRYLSYYLGKKIEEDRLNVYVNGKKNSKAELLEKRMMYHADTTVYEELFGKEYLVVSNYVWGEWESFEIKQAWTYDKRTNKLNTSVIDILPTYPDKLKREIRNISISFNQDMEKHKSIRSILNDERNIWIKMTSNFVSFDNIKILDDTDVDLKKILWSDPLEENKDLLERGYRGVLDTFDRESFLREGIDTIITFDLITYDENIREVERSIPEYKDVIGYNVEQLWYFDNEDLKLKCQLIGIEPLAIDVYSEKLEGLFYLKY